MCLTIYLDNVPFISICWLPDPVQLCYFFGKKIHFVKCCIFSESHQILVTRVLIFGSSPHCAGKCMAKLYTVYIAEAWQSSRKNVFELSNHFQFSHSNSFILSRHVLCWPCFDRFSSYGRRSRRTRLLVAKTIVSIFFCSITCFWVHNSEYKHLIPWHWTELVILFCSLTNKNRLMTKKSNKSHSIIFARNIYTEEQT